MPFAQQILLIVPTFLLGAIMVLSSVILSTIGLFIVRRFVPHHKLKIHNDVAGPIFGTLGVIYAVLLAFVVIIVWENFDASRQNVQKEANCLEDLVRDTVAFPEDFKINTRALLKEYGSAVVNDEWKTMEKGKNSPNVSSILRKIWLLYSKYEIKDFTDKAFFEESIRNLNQLSELRDTRLMDSKNGLHPVLWFVLIIGGLTTITFAFFFGTENLAAQLAMSILLSILVSLILFTIFALDYPFTGGISINPDPFRSIISNL